LKYFGGQPKDNEHCAEFISRCFDKTSGGFADHPGGKPDAITTAIGLMAVVEAKLPVKDYRDAAIAYLEEHAKSFEEVRLAAAALEAIDGRSEKTANWLDQIAGMRNQNGTYGKSDGVARATGSAVAAVLRLRGDVAHRDKVIHALKAGQRPDGGFGQEGRTGSDLDSSYRVVRAFVMLKEKPAVERMLAFIARCRNSDGGYGSAPGQPSQVGSTYNAAIIQHWLADK
jgi:prenyltransferase beta subunit